MLKIKFHLRLKEPEFQEQKEKIGDFYERKTLLLVKQLFHNFENIVMNETEGHFCYYALDNNLFILCLNELK